MMDRSVSKVGKDQQDQENQEGEDQQDEQDGEHDQQQPPEGEEPPPEGGQEQQRQPGEMTPEEAESLLDAIREDPSDVNRKPAAARGRKPKKIW